MGASKLSSLLLLAASSLHWQTASGAESATDHQREPAGAAQVGAPAPPHLLANDEASDEPPRLLANDEALWIYPEPSFETNPIGYVRAGEALRTRGPTPMTRRGCGGGWFAVEPSGYVCRDHRATFTPTRYTRGADELAPRDGAVPFHYALSLGAPAYRRAPHSAEREKTERPFGPPGPRALPSFWAHYGHLADAELPPSAELPWFFAEGGSVSREQESRLVRRTIPLGSTVAFVKTVEHDGGRFVLGADGTLVPSERLRVFRTSQFRGLELTPGQLELPVGFARRPITPHVWKSGPECPHFRADSPPAAPAPRAPSDAPPRASTDAAPSRTATAAPPRAPATPPRGLSPRDLPASCVGSPHEELPLRAPLALDPRPFRHQGELVRLARRLDDGRTLLVPESALFLAEERRAPSPTPERWIHFSIGRGVLVAYEKDRPSFVTLASPGAGGVPGPSGALPPRTTPLGLYRIQFKHRTDDMSPDWTDQKSHVVAEVPHAMYFAPPYAIHVAYWHEDFGEPRSGGCINVSPLDGERLFSWTSPQLPPGWHGVASAPSFGVGTTIWIER